MFNVNVLSPLMKQSVSIAPFQSYDGYGDASYGASVDYEAAVVGDIKRVVTQDGQEVPSRQTIYLKSAVMVRPEDQITLSTSDVGSTEPYAINPPILSVGLFPLGAHRGCTVIYLK
jgi:hypothetical protein|tara:strand:- start:204 stop:551 length:348 start_codon:yes stop_codon:yes gene_type:complete